MNNKRVIIAILSLSTIVFLNSCGILDTQIQRAIAETQSAWTPVPTLTPYPTFTPLPIPPTSTPITNQKLGDDVIGARWKVKVIKAEAVAEYETWSFPSGSKNHMVILTVEYTYLGSEDINFYPESAVLAYVDTDGFTGWSRTPRLYRGENSGITDFDTSATTKYVRSGDTFTDTFIYEFPNDYRNFIFYFPETLPIEVQVK